MGIIIGKFRKNKSTYEVLEKLENEIKSIDEFKRNTEERQKRFVRRLLVFGGLAYIIFLTTLYFYFNFLTNQQKALCLFPLLVSPLIIWFMKRILTWYYNRKIRKNQNKLVSLNEQKKKMIDNVMETETYKVAKLILDKFAQEPKKKMEIVPRTPSVGNSETGLRQRYVPQARGRLSMGNPITPLTHSGTPIQPSRIQQQRPMPMVKSMTNATQMSMSMIPGTPLPLPRGVLPRDRGVLDKMVDYLVGDGPSNRFALICKACSSHNGMALKEEFEFLSFRCCYCSVFNPARKKKPSAPQLELSTMAPKAIENVSTSESEKYSDSDSDDSVEKNPPIVTEPPEDELDAKKEETCEKEEGEKHLDLEVKGSDTESTPMDVDAEKEEKDVTSDS
ncbi:unnamed protein product [Brassicogethes aeneus]|uniref:Endoplasmic reticulum junction formation protein lunapark n=1 Tax=Brassicogethes aeneus TaxID=1431903 RepID=A0A9P0B1B6_BRAAE|nr:unnamed protein product [Brassicogethes aeneus]